MPKFFVEPSKISDGKIIIDTDDTNHIIKVLRMEVEAELTVCDGCGTDYLAKIEAIEKNCVVLTIISSKKSDTEPKLKVTLYQALPKASKMEYIIQKTTELGITRLVPVTMSRCVSKLDGKKDGEKKAARWQKIAESAAKQSGRGIVPEVNTPIGIDEAISELKGYDLAFVPYECEETLSIKNVIKGINGEKSVGFIIGPEGGFAAEEIQKVVDAGIQTVTLGPRILRTETAGETVLAMLMYEADELQ